MTKKEKTKRRRKHVIDESMKKLKSIALVDP